MLLFSKNPKSVYKKNIAHKQNKNILTLANGIVSKIKCVLMTYWQILDSLVSFQYPALWKNMAILDEVIEFEQGST